MARNKVQFQRGLSLAEFNRLYGREDQCHDALVKMRWPGGFVCPKCRSRAHAYCEPRRLFQCSTCRVQTSVRAGTIFHKSRTPLTKWFFAMHLITSAKNDIAALELVRQLDVKWDTAWLMKQKLLEVMLQRNSTYRLAGDIQIDGAYQGGEKPAIPGKSGRGARNKLPFVIAMRSSWTVLRRTFACSAAQDKPGRHPSFPAYPATQPFSALRPSRWAGYGCFVYLAARPAQTKFALALP